MPIILLLVTGAFIALIVSILIMHRQMSPHHPLRQMLESEAQARGGHVQETQLRFSFQGFIVNVGFSQRRDSVIIWTRLPLQAHPFSDKETPEELRGLQDQHPRLMIKNGKFRLTIPALPKGAVEFHEWVEAAVRILARLKGEMVHA